MKRPNRYWPIIMAVLTTIQLSSQEKFQFPPLSPKGSISQTVGNTTISMVYERPAARGRMVFGDLVPWGKVWRTGAGNCTKISFDKSVEVGGNKVPSGTYSLFTIPDKEQWTIILNRDTTLYGSGFYDSRKDLTRFKVVPKRTHRFHETLNLDIEIIPNNAEVYISWENTQVSFSITTTTDELVENFIQNELLTGKNEEYENYAFAADYYYFQDKSLEQSIWLADKAIETGKDGGWARNIKIEVYFRLKKYDLAAKELEIAIEAVKNSDYDKEVYRQRDLDTMRKRLSRIRLLSQKN